MYTDDYRDVIKVGGVGSWIEWSYSYLCSLLFAALCSGVNLRPDPVGQDHECQKKGYLDMSLIPKPRDLRYLDAIVSSPCRPPQTSTSTSKAAT